MFLPHSFSLAFTAKLVAVLLLLLSGLAAAHAQTEAKQASLQDAYLFSPENYQYPRVSNIRSEKFLLMDFKTAKVFLSKGANQHHKPASLTKLLTAYIIFSNIKQSVLQLDEVVTTSENAWKRGGSSMFLKVGQKVTVKDLLHGLIIQSGNDAAIALAEHLSGSEENFARTMNATAQELGMINSHFVNSTGWDAEDQYTTAYDMALLARSLIENFPEFFAIYSKKSFTFNDVYQTNRNLLLWKDSSVDGLKTGHLKAAGYNLVSTAKRGDFRIISILLGARSESSRAKESLILLNYGFRYFASKQIVPALEKLHSLQVYEGDKPEVQIGTLEPIYTLLPKNQVANLKLTLDAAQFEIAPIERWQEIASVEAKIGNFSLGSYPVYALSEVKKGPWYIRFVHKAMLYFQEF